MQCANRCRTDFQQLRLERMQLARLLKAVYPKTLHLRTSPSSRVGLPGLILGKRPYQKPCFWTALARERERKNNIQNRTDWTLSRTDSWLLFKAYL